MAGKLKLFYAPYGSPGDVENKTISSIGGETATYAHWIAQAKKALAEQGGFAEAEQEALIEGNTTIRKFLVNINQVQNIIEF